MRRVYQIFGWDDVELLMVTRRVTEEEAGKRHLAVLPRSLVGLPFFRLFCGSLTIEVSSLTLSSRWSPF